MMTYGHFLDLINNLALLLVVAFLFDLAGGRRLEKQPAARQALLGLAIGVIGITIMLIPWTFAPGIAFDFRSVLLGISGLFLGWIPTLIAMGMAAAFRLVQGGGGTWTGISIIFTAGAIGLAWRHARLRYLPDMTWRELYVFGLVIHGVMLCLLLLTFPWETALKVTAQMLLPLILIYPFGTMLLGLLLVNRLQHLRAERKLLESERFARSTMDALTAHIAVLDEDGTILAVNKAWQDFALANPPVFRCDCGTTNYLEACKTARGKDREQALAFADGIRAVKSGEKKEFSLEYPCHSPAEQRWFVGRVTRFEGPGPLRIVVAHENITKRKRAEQELQRHRDSLEELVALRTRELEQRNTELVREVSDRQKAEKAIRESEERFRILVDLAPDIIYRIREDKTIDFISSAVSQLGWRPEELIGKSFEEFIHPDDREKVRGLLVEKRIGDRRAKNVEVRLLTRNREEQDYALSHSFVEISARGYWDVADSDITRPDKNFLYTLGIARDITTRKKAEEDLRESERRMALLKNVASAANAAATMDDVFRTAIEGIARYIGWPVGHVYIADERNSERLVPTDIWYLEDAQRFHLFRNVTAQTVFTPGVGMVGRILTARKTVWIEDVTAHPGFLRKKLSEDVHVCGAFGFPVLVGGKVAAVLEFFSAKTEQPRPTLMNLMDEIGVQLGIVIQRKRAEEELKKLYRAVEQSPATVVITDVKGQIQYVNPRFTKLTSYTPEEAIGQTPHMLSSGVHPQSFYADLWETILSGQEWFGTFCNRKKNGELYWESASISPVRDESGAITNFVAVKEDITKLLRYEEELKLAKEWAENASRAKSDFLAGMSHELRTPLNAIIGFSEVLKEQFFGPLVEKQEEYVDDILESGRHLLSIINDILDLSKVEAGKMDLEPAEISVADLIGGSMIMVKEKAARHRISLERDIAKEVENLVIMADQRKLRQVLYNLLSNAEKFTPDGGSIRLSARIVLASPPADAEPQEAAAGKTVPFLEIAVADTGIGIDAENLEKVFDPFFQVEGSRQGKTPGTGLGLPLSRELIELHGGTLRGESEGPGKGSTFIFRIPLSQNERNARAGS
ncbi:MAG: PAS domain S-box protein [Deltaproteobacteria bacterium]|nr:PAS domain S-box protein [Deltaproteobacteria bacterium]